MRHSPAQAVGDGEDHRQHDHQAGVEEDGEAEDQGGQAQREGGALLAEDPTTEAKGKDRS